MKIEKIQDTKYCIYDYSSSISEHSIIDTVKSIFERLQKHYSFKGFYHVIVTARPFGLFLQVQLIEDSLYKNTLDLKIEENPNQKIYYRTKDYFLIKDFSLVYYYEGVYYGLLEDSFYEILEKVEFGDFVFGDYWDYLLKHGKIV